MLKNGSFEAGWTDIDVEGITRNQQPFFWDVGWLWPGEKLYGSEDKATAVPECVHKHRDQLPHSEHPGQPGALILDGVYVYKIFHGHQPFGAELSQVVRGLEPGTMAQLSVGLLLDAPGTTDPHGAEVCVQIVGHSEQWLNVATLGQREWKRPLLEATVPSTGEVKVMLFFKSKWPSEVNFFIDDIKFDCTTAPVGPPPPPGDDPIVITVIVPGGVEVEVERV